MWHLKHHLQDIGYGQYKALLPQKVPVVIQLLTTVNILLLPLRRKVWRHETRTVDFTLLWAKRQSAVITRRRQKLPRTSQYNGNPCICWWDTEQPPRNMLYMEQKALVPEATSFLYLHTSFPYGKGQGSFFAVFARYKDIFYSLILPLGEGWSFLPLQAGKYEGSATDFLNVVLFPAQLCKLAVLPSLPSFLYTHSHVWRTVNHI